MTPAKPFWRLARLPLAVGLASSMAVPAHAVSFNIGEMEVQLDSALSVGASWSTAKRDRDLVGAANGGTGYTQTGDDGRLNFKRGETFSKIFKGNHDLELRYGDSGAFIRGKYWYDFELKDESRLHKDISDSNRKEGAQSSGAQILDAFLYHNYSLGEQPGSIRFGRQVVSWGESTFISNGINSINPVDAAAFRRPGAEIKEALLPVNMIYLSQSLTDQLAMEAFYQLEWDQTIVDNCGTFFASDVLQDGCVGNYHVQQYPATLAAALRSVGAQGSSEGVMVRRAADRDARDSGQWGLALRWMGEETEYGAYAMNYHSRTPNISYINADRATITNIATTAASLPAAARQSFTSLALLGSGSYFLEYPEDIRLYGLSFSTSLPTGTAWQGEISYRPNMPLQVNTTDTTGWLAAGIGASLAAGNVPAALAQAGREHQGYSRKEVTQAQTTFTHFVDQVMGAERVTLVGEIGMTRIGGLESHTERRYGRDSIFGGYNDASAVAKHGQHGFYTRTSWGYRARAVWDYSNVIAGINLSPNLTFSHDVDGYGPVFNEGSKAISVGLDANYRNTYSASLSYTNFFGGDYNVMTDRDFLALSVGVNF